MHLVEHRCVDVVRDRRVIDVATDAGENHRRVHAPDKLDLAREGPDDLDRRIVEVNPHFVDHRGEQLARDMIKIRLRKRRVAKRGIPEAAIPGVPVDMRQIPAVEIGNPFGYRPGSVSQNFPPDRIPMGILDTVVDRGDQIGLGWEIAMDQWLGNVHPVGECLHRDAEAPIRKQFHGRIKQDTAALIRRQVAFPLAAGRCGPSASRALPRDTFVGHPRSLARKPPN